MYLFGLDIDVKEVGESHVVHNKVALLFVHLQEEGFVLNDVSMM